MRARPERIAHRGAPREFRENTLPAFERALERGADAIELDVHSASDGVVVVHHDPVLSRTVDGVLEGTPIDAMTWAELQTVELVPGVSLPSLSQVLDLIGVRARVYVELKGAGIEALVLDVIRNSEALCAIHSFDHASIARAARLAPGIRRGVLFEDALSDLGAVLHNTQALDVWPRWDIVDRALVEEAHRCGARVLPWTVNAPETAYQLRALGVDGLCTDDVRLLA